MARTYLRRKSSVPCYIFNGESKCFFFFFVAQGRNQKGERPSSASHHTPTPQSQEKILLGEICKLTIMTVVYFLPKSTCKSTASRNPACNYVNIIYGLVGQDLSLKKRNLSSEYVNSCSCLFALAIFSLFIAAP